MMHSLQRFGRQISNGFHCSRRKAIESSIFGPYHGAMNHLPMLHFSALCTSGTHAGRTGVLLDGARFPKLAIPGAWDIRDIWRVCCEQENPWHYYSASRNLSEVLRGEKLYRYLRLIQGGDVWFKEANHDGQFLFHRLLCMLAQQFNSSTSFFAHWTRACISWLVRVSCGKDAESQGLYTSDTNRKRYSRVDEPSAFHLSLLRVVAEEIVQY